MNGYYWPTTAGGLVSRPNDRFKEGKLVGWKVNEKIGEEAREVNAERGGTHRRNETHGRFGVEKGGRTANLRVAKSKVG